MTDQPLEPSDGFFEEDQPVEDIVAAFNAGPHGVTEPPLAAAGQLLGSRTFVVIHAPYAADARAYQQA